MNRTLAVLIAACFPSASAFAKDGKLLDIDIDVNKAEWYENPWVWVGVAVFILLALLILRRGKR